MRPGVLDADRFDDAVRDRLRSSIDDARAFAARAVEGLDDSTVGTTAALETCVSDLVDAGGKFVRPRLVRLGYLAVADEAAVPQLEADAVVRMAAAFELLHVFGLLQDDVMDGSDTRRGHPSAHRRIAEAVATQVPIARSGGERLGESIAVLAGDLAFALAGRLVRGVPDAVADAWDATVVELVQGQRLDLLFAAEGRLDENSTMRVAQAKSGAYTVRRPLEVGALLAGLDAPPAWLSTYGVALGEAFALADDVIGIWGDPAVTGKPAGEDLRERKPSSVIGLADTLLGGEMTQLLAPDAPALDAAGVARLVAHMDAAGIRAEAGRRITACRTRALDALPASLTPGVREEFERFADDLSSRDA